NGHLYVADPGKGSILVLTVPDGAGGTFVTGLNSPVGLAIDIVGNLYVSEASTGNIIKFTPDKTKTTFATNAGEPAGMAFDNSGNLFVADFGGGKIYKYSPAGAQSVFATGLDFPADVAIDSAGNIFVSDSGSGTIFKFTPDGTKSTFASGLSRPYGLAFESSGNLVVADNEEGATLRFSPAGVKGVIFQSDFNTPQFVAVEPASHRLLNLSTRGLVQGEENPLIAGFVVGGAGPIGTSILVRALGPSLAPFGVPNPLPDPVLELHDASGALIATNNNWKQSQQAAITNTGLAPKDDHESAILVPLKGGAYTAVVRSANGAPGTAVVEVYSLE
ncbi:MAG TPA: NHL repeat-containing protein, partial [Chthoniobacterales bacterium]|nr:NHL repeat-containing protein [Chthoniobacterales bacterium]